MTTPEIEKTTKEIVFYVDHSNKNNDSFILFQLISVISLRSNRHACLRGLTCETISLIIILIFGVVIIT